MSKLIKLWFHFCPKERGEIGTETGCECNWCGKRESN